MANWDTTKPADSDLVRNFPAAHRTDKTSLRDQLQVEHDVLPATGTPTGRHKFPSGNTLGRPADPVTGSIYFNTQTGQIEQWDGAAWVGRTDFGSGTVMLFKQATAPTGWTRVVDAGNTDATIILRQNSEVPTVGGTWAVGGLTVNAHTHTQAGSHASGAAQGGIDIAASPGAGGPGLLHGHTTTLSGQTGTASVNGITSDSTWRPKHVDVIVASKN